MTDRPHLHSLADIKAMLNDQVHRVAYHYAPPAKGSYEDKGLYFTLNPGRADRSVGSFWVTLKPGKWQGHWKDAATGHGGDLLDLIQLAMGLSPADALREARQFLGLVNETPADRARREKAMAASAARAQEAERRAAEDLARRKDQALGIYLSARERIAGTPVQAYLRDSRAIDLAALGSQPRALRYQPKCYFKQIDTETGECFEGEGPAMVAAVSSISGETVAVHRTWLALGADGKWGKAPLPQPRKALGPFGGASIRLRSGIGPQGGKGAPLNKCPAGSHVFISEGIEDALSCAILLPEARVLAAISLGNMGGVKLPRNVAKVTLIADRDPGPEQQAALKHAVSQYQKQGRRVAVWQNSMGGKDLNDALMGVTTQKDGDDGQ
ncbi:DUF7146 domain-containing protein [Oceaniglobus trochenteri]|uniref:DUF7146 domain-containing protein n=1 Tax=Oceaniglobus trochenteri TaxID=2763260 RepID=UPI001CFF97A5|nr:toprim domain-containing protein [Oceaniglobus trochenteri]